MNSCWTIITWKLGLGRFLETTLNSGGATGGGGGRGHMPAFPPMIFDFRCCFYGYDADEAVISQHSKSSGNICEVWDYNDKQKLSIKNISSFDSCQ